MARAKFGLFRKPAALPVILFFVVFVGFADRAAANSLTIQTATGQHTFDVEIMRTPSQRAKGLMFRQSLPKYEGMLFDFMEDAPASMWMKNTYIPLDMLFIRSDGTIANIAENTVPHSTRSISSEGDVRYVLEINGGLSAEFGIKPGDKVVLPVSN